MKYLIVGLGNVGAEYAGTRHNVGFMVLDALASASSTSFSSARLADVATLSYRGRRLVLVKPTTLMNLSGRAVHYWMEKECVPLSRVLVVVDDLALPIGSIRLRAKGSNGGHNGLRDIEQRLSSSAYARLRIGIGRDFSRGRQIDYVLSPFEEEERSLLKDAISQATEAIELFVTIGTERAMNRVNTAQPKGKGPDARR